MSKGLDYLKKTAGDYESSGRNIRGLVGRVEKLADQISDFDSDKVLSHMDEKGMKNPLKAYRDLTNKADDWKPDTSPVTPDNVEERLTKTLFRGKEPENDLSRPAVLPESDHKPKI